MSDDGHKPREARVTINKDFGSFDEFIREYVTNISKTGAFVKRANPLPIGTEINLKFTVIMDELETIEGIGEVVRAVHPGEGPTPGMGVVFIELTSVSRQLVEKILVRR